MLRGLQQFINIPMTYVDELLERIDGLGQEQKRDVERYLMQQDQHFGPDERPIFRQKIRNMILSEIEKCSFFEQATNGKSENVIGYFTWTLDDELVYRSKGGVPITSELVHEIYQLTNRLIPSTHKRMFFIFEAKFPNKDTDLSESAEDARYEEIDGLSSTLKHGFTHTDFYKELVSQSPTDIVTLAEYRISQLVDLVVMDECLAEAISNPPTAK